MRIEKVNFTTSDRLNLYGILYLPEQETEEVVIFVHGIHSNCFKKKDDIFGKELNKNNIAYFTFDNRGANTITKINGKLYGAAYEEPAECIYDINAAIKVMKEKGYKKINLLGHSLGSSKVLYWYNNDKKHEINTIGLLSLTDMHSIVKSFLGIKYNFLVGKMKKQRLSTLIPQEMFKNINILPLSINTFLKLFIEPEFDLVNYSDVNVDNLNKVKEPLFMRFGTINEYLVKNSAYTVSQIMTKITKNNIDISYIEDADHSYHGKEEKLINEYIQFIKNNR